MALQRGRGVGLRQQPDSIPSLQAGHVAELVAELQPLLKGCSVREIQPLPPRDLLLIVEPPPTPDGPPILRLRLSASPETARLHLQQDRVLVHDGPEGPFFKLLNEELAGATVRRVEQVRGDRIVRLEFGATPSGRRRALMAELVGRHSNLILVGPEDEVLGMLVPTPARKAHTPRIVLGQAWSPPGGKAGPGADSASLTEVYAEPDALPPGPVKDRAPLSWRVECAVGGAAQLNRRDSLRKKLQSRAQRKLTRARGLVKGLRKRSSAIEGAERVQQDGELLKSVVGTLKRGQSSVEVPDWFTEGAPPRTLELDPRRQPAENVQRYFDRHKKLLRGRESLERELQLAQDKVTGLEALLLAAEDADQDPAALDAQAVEAGLLDKPQEADPRKRKAPEPRKPYLSYRVHGDLEARVGRTAKDNDDLTFRHARGNDLWMHTADCPGSHVVLRLERGQEAPQEAILEAGMLAVHFSPARQTGRAQVHVAPIKQVHKPRGAKPGLVTLSGGKTMHVRVKQTRLAELLRG